MDLLFVYMFKEIFRYNKLGDKFTGSTHYLNK